MANIGGSQTGEFGAGVNHQVNAGRGNDNSVTLGGSLQSDSDRQSAVTPHAALTTTVGTGSPADTDAGVEWGQEAAGNTDDAEQAGQSMNRMMMQRAAGIGTDDDVS
jgi:hypothetical protein